MSASATQGSMAPASRLKSPRSLWLLLVGGAAAYFGILLAYPRGLFALGINYPDVWFLDLFAILASNDALARGLDVYAANPLDYLQRPHVYSHWWLELGRLGLTRADTFWLGLMLGFAFFAVAVARLRPRTFPEVGWYLLILCSSPVLLAVHRANNDLVIFLLLAAVVPCLWAKERGVRHLAIVPIALATALKFYPAAAALILLFGSDPREVKFRLALALVAFGLVLLGLRNDFAPLSGLAQRAEGLMTFGAGNLFGWFGIGGWKASVLALGAGGLIAAAFARSRILTGWTAASDQSAWLSFVLGAAVLTTCFFVGMNFAYRWVFALWLAPFLWQTWTNSNYPPRIRRFSRLTGGLLVLALWIDPLTGVVLTNCAKHFPGEVLGRWADRIFMAEQPITWAFFACLVGWLVHFLREQALRLIASKA